MLIVCPQCDSRYELANLVLPEEGRTVRCARCRTEWTLRPAAGHAAAPEDDLVFVDAPEPEPGDMLPPAPQPVLHGIPDLPEVAPAPMAAEPAGPDAAPQEPGPSDVEAVAVRRNAPVRRSRPRRTFSLRRLLPGRRLLAGIAAAALFVGVFAFRERIVQAVPAAADLYAAVGLGVNLRGLAFEGVTTSHASEGGSPVLVIEGTIRNVTRQPQAVPRLKLAVRDTSGQEVYGWTTVPPRDQLEPGASLAFRSRLAQPPEGRDVLVRFVRREDLLFRPKLPAPAAPPESGRHAG